MLVVARREVAAEMDAARLGALQRGADHQASDGQQVLQFPTGSAVEFARQCVSAPERHVACGLFQAGTLANHAHVSHHQAAQRIRDIGDVQPRAGFRLQLAR